MRRKRRINVCITGALLLLSVLFTMLLKTVDVRPIGPERSRVGLAALNGFVFQRLGTSAAWDAITDWLGLAAVLVAAGFALQGFLQLVKRKSLWRVDAGLLLLGVFYGLVLLAYVLFEHVVINYRPVMMDSVLEASYPSSHTMLVGYILATAMLRLPSLLKNRAACVTAQALCAAAIAVTCMGRLLSGVHWFTDILGALLIGATLVMAYATAVSYVEGKHPSSKPAGQR